MLDAVSGWLQDVGTAAFTWSALAFIVLNGAGVLMLALRREQGLVNRWTSRFLAANLLLLGTELGIPLATFAA